MIKEKIYNYEKAHNQGYDFKTFLTTFLKDRETNLEALMADKVTFDIWKKLPEILETMKAIINNNKTITIIGDYDVDGITSSSILYKSLTAILGDHVNVILPDRKNDGYGLKEKLVDKCMEINTGFIITVDNGINAIPAVKYALSKGIEVFVTDHHIPNDEEYKTLKWCMNPHTNENSLKEKEVCGAYVALTLGLNLLKISNAEVSEKFIKELHELAAIGTIADVMPIRYENRALLHYCIPRFKNGVALNKGLQLLMSSLDKGSLLEQDNIAFYLTPCINASGRLDSAMRGFNLFTGDNLVSLAKQASELVSLNERRKTISKELEDYLVNQIDKDSRVQVIQVPKNFNDFSDREIGGVIGIVAQKVVEKSQCPSLIFYGDRMSGRSMPDVNLNKLLASAKTPTFSFGGHAQACGGGVDFEKYGNALRNELSNNVKDFEEVAYSRFIRVPDWMKPTDILEAFESLKPCDLTAFPKLMMEDVEISNVMIFGDQHTQISFKLGGKTVKAMKFYDKIEIAKETKVKRLVFKITPATSSTEDFAIIVEQIVM